MVWREDGGSFAILIMALIQELFLESSLYHLRMGKGTYPWLR